MLVFHFSRMCSVYGESLIIVTYMNSPKALSEAIRMTVWARAHIFRSLGKCSFPTSTTGVADSCDTIKAAGETAVTCLMAETKVWASGEKDEEYVLWIWDELSFWTRATRAKKTT